MSKQIKNVADYKVVRSDVANSSAEQITNQCSVNWQPRQLNQLAGTTRKFCLSAKKPNSER